MGVRHVDPETEQPLADAPRWARLNWSAYDNRENLPEEYLYALESLPEVMRERMLNGVWRDNEGAVYSEFDEDLHVVEPFEVPADWKRIRAIDFGYTNPFVCLWGALDPDGAFTFTGNTIKPESGPRTCTDHSGFIRFGALFHYSCGPRCGRTCGIGFFWNPYDGGIQKRDQRHSKCEEPPGNLP